MPTPLENELGLGPVMHRVRRWSRNVVSRIGNGAVADDRRSLDPLTVNYAAWHEVRRKVREWPNYKEAANSLEILVSPEDWEDYWGIDTPRKEAGVAAYVQARAAEKGYWMSGDPQVKVEPDEVVMVGEVEVYCRFSEPVEGEGYISPSSTATFEPLNAYADEQYNDNVGFQDPMITNILPTQEERAAQEAPTIRFVDAKSAGKARLTDGQGFCLEIESGDCIGAVVEDEECPPEVNVRLDSDRFPYVESKQCSIGVLDGRWTITNFAYHGTMIMTAEGSRMMLGTSEPYALQEGDVVFLGPNRPLRFELVGQ